ncbi:hypothetical protein OHS71_20370 [Streptomyces sp. NBC_00377]|uniref:hypothetical protein n=1 Tax=unclassified Streptomyces TaxID=2593676 RepID=UPI002E1C9BD0|nr:MULTISPECIES: hypothetical protein [unclassified Streptomyces]
MRGTGGAGGGAAAVWTGIGAGDPWAGATGRTGPVAGAIGAPDGRRWTARGENWAGWCGTPDPPGADGAAGSCDRPEAKAGVGYGRATGWPAAAPGAVRRNATGALTALRCTADGMLREDGDGSDDGDGDGSDDGDAGDEGDTGGLPEKETGCGTRPCPSVAVGRTALGSVPVVAVAVAVVAGVKLCGDGPGRCAGVPGPDAVADKGSSEDPEVPVLRCTTGDGSGGRAGAVAPGPDGGRGAWRCGARGMPLGASSGAASAGRADSGAPSAGRPAAGREGRAVAATGRAARWTGAPRGVER